MHQATKFAATCLAFVLLWSMAFAGGLSGVGGGSGVLCLPTGELVHQVDAALEAHQPVPDDVLRAGDFQLLEDWETGKLRQHFWEAAPGVSADVHLENVKNFWRRIFPVFMDRLDRTAAAMPFAQWNPVPQLPLFDDVTPIAPLGESCRRLQIVLRNSEGNNAKGEGPVAKPTSLSLRYVPAYYARLSVTDQAALRMHEELYALGQSVGHQDSDYMRGFMRLFFDEKVARALPSELLLRPPGGLRLMKTYLIQFFGDYPTFYRDVPEASAAAFSSRHHFLTYVHLHGKITPQIDQCISNGKAAEDCVREVMDRWASGEHLTNEEAFLIASVNWLERIRGFNSDQVMNPTPRDQDIFPRAMQSFCAELDAAPGSTQVPLWGKARAYCRDWRATVNR